MPARVHQSCYTLYVQGEAMCDECEEIMDRYWSNDPLAEPEAYEQLSLG